jgi:hypothetical protein
LRDELRPDRSRNLEEERVAEVINTALQSPPPQVTHWPVRAMAEHTGISKSAVRGWFELSACNLIDPSFPMTPPSSKSPRHHRPLPQPARPRPGVLRR